MGLTQAGVATIMPLSDELAGACGLTAVAAMPWLAGGEPAALTLTTTKGEHGLWSRARLPMAPMGWRTCAERAPNGCKYA